MNGLLARLREAVSGTELPELQRDGGDELDETMSQSQADRYGVDEAMSQGAADDYGDPDTVDHDWDTHEWDDGLHESVSAAERKSATKSGDAFSDGSYPIRTQKQADDAWGLRNNSKKHSEQSVIAHIRKQVKKHGLTMPSSPTKESLRFLIREAGLTKDGTTYEATIVREGPGNPEDANYYTKEALREAVNAGLFEGLHAYANHPTPTEEAERPERDVRQLVGHFREARFIDGQRAEVRAKFVPISGPGYEWVTSLIESALDSVPGRPLIGISIDGYGHAPDTQEINGRTYNMVREVTHLGSADIVTRAGAGGQFHQRLQEAWRNSGPDRRPGTSKEVSMKIKAAEMQSKIKAAAAKLQEATGLKDDDDKGEELVTEAVTILQEVASAELVPEIKIEEKRVEVPVAASNEEKDQLAAKLREAETERDTAIADAKSQKQRRRAAEEQLQEAARAKVAAKILREAEVPSKTAASWFEDVVACEDEQAMKAFVERKVAERNELLAELREDYGVEGAGRREPVLAGGGSSGGGLLDRMGIDSDELAE